MNGVDIAIIGAGPYGLALAAHLVKKGLNDIRVFGGPNGLAEK
jgi:2-polyprenyl-6-methoxyphenol hydroxylase-like FAD-dependent oxidoreductase